MDLDEKVTHQLPKGVFTIDRRYRPLRVIGVGAYGVVCAAVDEVSRKNVAIKKINDVFTIPTIAKRTLREIKLLKHFHGHDNILNLLNVLQPCASQPSWNDVYIVSDLMESDLHRIIHSPQQLTEEHIRLFLYQLLRGLKYIHSANVLHRDIKPSNLLVTSDCELKICDFGMARGVHHTVDDHSAFMTAYVATRWYRAPEVLLSLKQYTYAIDMWSVGCILAEMLGRRYLFPGSNYVEQLKYILNVLGSPEPSFVQSIGSDIAVKYLRSLPKMERVPLHQIYPNASADAVDMVEQMLQFEPSRRLTAEQALAHPFLTKYHSPSEEPSCPAFDFSFDESQVAPEQLKALLLQEMKEYDRPRRRYAPSDASSPQSATPSQVGSSSQPFQTAATTTTPTSSTPSSSTSLRAPLMNTHIQELMQFLAPQAKTAPSDHHEPTGRPKRAKVDDDHGNEEATSTRQHVPLETDVAQGDHVGASCAIAPINSAKAIDIIAQELKGMTNSAPIDELVNIDFEALQKELELGAEFPSAGLL